MNGVANGGLRVEYLFEKKLNGQLKDGMKEVEAEKIKVGQRVKALEKEAETMKSDGIQMGEELTHKEAIVEDLSKDY